METGVGTRVNPPETRSFSRARWSLGDNGRVGDPNRICEKLTLWLGPCLRRNERQSYNYWVPQLHLRSGGLGIELIQRLGIKILGGVAFE